ncbi:MAG: biotin transporter BioY [Candidatus Omnitrophica bacterium]|nr:biotin transporter BioY [Candidatus Omnitrophota bacterium]
MEVEMQKLMVLKKYRILMLEWMGVMVFTLLMIFSANIRIPLFFTPVPITLQNFIIFLSVLYLKDKAWISQTIYIILGAIGLPVFAKGGAGLSYFLGPTGGYLIGFILSSFICGWLIREYGNVKNFNLYRYFLIFLLGSMIILFSGVLWLSFILGFSLRKALMLGMFPFILGDTFKSLLASIIAVKLRRPDAREEILS